MRQMIQKTTSLILSGVVLFSTSCASIVSKSRYPISINSAPTEASLVITDKKGIEIFSGQTPASMKLSAGSGFFGKARYQATITKDGYQSKTVPIDFKLDGWYFGNILLGGVIGMLIVDPATGAMYKLDTEFLNETLAPSTAGLEKSELKVYSLTEVPKDWKSHLEAVE